MRTAPEYVVLKKRFPVNVTFRVRARISDRVMENLKIEYRSYSVRVGQLSRAQS